MRWGIEHLNIDDKRLKELGATGLMPPLKVSCLDHEGCGAGRSSSSGTAPSGRYHRLDRARPQARARQGRERSPRSTRRRRASRRATAPGRDVRQGIRALHGEHGTAGRGSPFLFVGASRGERRRCSRSSNIEVIYDHVILVLRGVSLEVQRGQIVALLGANGAGKTTTLKAISNLLRAERGDVTKGQILYRGERIDRLNPGGAGEARHLPGDGRPPLLPAPDGGGEPADRRLHARLARRRACARTWRRCTRISRASRSGASRSRATPRAASSR